MHNALRKQLMEIIVPRGGAKTVRAISGKRIAAGYDKIDVNNVVPNKWVSGLSSNSTKLKLIKFFASLQSILKALSNKPKRNC